MTNKKIDKRIEQLERKFRVKTSEPTLQDELEIMLGLQLWEYNPDKPTLDKFLSDYRGTPWIDTVIEWKEILGEKTFYATYVKKLPKTQEVLDYEKRIAERKKRQSKLTENANVRAELILIRPKKNP